jgi:iron complex outermembrane receptor protein
MVARPVSLLLALLPAAFLSAGAARAAGTVTGIVRDGESGDPLFAANVLVTSLVDPTMKMGRLTDRDGMFRVPDLAPGRYEIRASFVGFETFVIDALQVADGATAEVEMALVVEPIEMNKVIVSASRREEKVLDAPASVQVVEGKEVREKAVLSPADHLQGRPAVDVQRAGINQGTVVIRGFNNIFSGATLTLVDNRIARVPSLRYNALNLIPTANLDIEQIELVSGPGAALYGPNSANGVLHIRTRSPFGSEGTTLSVGGGEQDVLIASGRHAGSLDDKYGWKVTGEYYQATDWESTDPAEQQRRMDALPSDPDTRIGLRDFDVERTAGTAQLNARLTPESELIVNGGWNQMSAIELTGLGAVQADDWVTTYGQMRYRWKDLFLQGYVNTSSSGETYNLRTGDELVDESKFFVAQAQHQLHRDDRHTIVYGVDALFTRPDTDGTINGRNEDDDDINEIGGYLQSESVLSEKWTTVTAVRLDEHNHIDDPVFSPRAAVVFSPAAGHKLRGTYNRAYSTPSTNNLFLDLVTSEDLFRYGTATMLDAQDLFAEGVPEGGFTFRRDSGGGLDGLYMTVPPALLAINGSATSQLPADATLLWNAARTLAAQQAGVPAIATIPAPSPGEVATVLRTLNPTIAAFGTEITPPSEVIDVGEMQPTISNTFEVGYKGLIGRRLVAAIDVYYQRIEDFVGPLRVETPNTFLDPATLGTYLVSEGYTPAEAQAYAGALAAIPLGTVTPENSPVGDGDLILTYRNFGDVDLTGVDLGIQVLLNDMWSALLSYSFVSEDFFEDVEGELDVALNAPSNKAGAILRYDNRHTGVGASARVRFVDGFPVESGIYVGDVEAYTLLDLSASWQFIPSTSVSAVVQNVLDNEHREFVGTPEIGRLGLVRLTHSF